MKITPKLAVSLTLTIGLLAALSALASTENLDVGGTELAIPPPEGYVRVTGDMVAVHRSSLQMQDPANDLVAYYISESDAPVARQGEPLALAKRPSSRGACR